jgi:hypothetical protein
MIEAWMLWVVGGCAFAASSGIFFWLGLVKGQHQAKDWLDFVRAGQENANVAASHANVAQELKDKRTAAYFASQKERGGKRRDLANAINGHDEGH